MEWMAIIGNSIQYIEAHIEEELSVERIARAANVSPFYFQKGFAMLCGFTVAEYIRSRRLALAGNALLTTDERIIDLALKYGYDSPDSFTRAFTRFHGATPAAVRRDGAMLRSFAPLKIRFSLEGGYLMIFPSTGALPNALQGVNQRIFTEWLPAMQEYEFAAGYCVEYYDDPSKYEKGTQDDKYYCEIWIPVKKK